jgi:glutathione S-transferase
MAGHVLYTIPISHYCEKARWALDRAGVPYRERAHLQVIHRFVSIAVGRSKTMPVLTRPDGPPLTESAEIVRYADAQMTNGKRLFPDDPAVRTEVLDLERDLDERLGVHARRWMYHHVGDRRDIALMYGCTGVPAWERRLLPIGYPVMMAVVNRILDVDAERAAESERMVRAVFDMIDERLSDGRPYLCGDSFTAADLAFAALSAAVLVPPGYGVPLPQPAELPPYASALAEELRARPSGAHALAMYRTERRPAAAAGLTAPATPGRTS